RSAFAKTGIDLHFLLRMMLRAAHLQSGESGEDMITNLIELEDAKERLASGEQPYAFQTSDDVSMLGPACRFGTHYLRKLQSEGGYAESYEEAVRLAEARGATVTGIWFVKPSQQSAQ